jgi:aspartate/methionine/tyrosine aminotransferase
MLPSPLERWFTTHPGPHAHSLAGTAAAAPGWATIAPFLAAGWERHIDWGYAEPEGDPELRDLVATALGVTTRHEVLLTQGAAEANWLALASLVRPGGRVIVQTPIYPQLPCVAAGLGGEVIAWELPPDPDEPADLVTLAALLAPGAGLLVINSPHNPTGRIFDAATLEDIVQLARAAGCILLVDEVYRGVGEGAMPPSALSWGTDGVLASGSLSKAVALPGLRLGWLAGDAGLIARAVPWREHTTLALAGPAVALAIALWPHLEELAARNRALLARNRAIALGWLGAQDGWTGRAPTTAGVLLCGPLNSVDDVAWAEEWYARCQGLVIPASVCGYPGRFRIGFGHAAPGALEAALASFAANVATTCRREARA